MSFANNAINSQITDKNKAVGVVREDSVWRPILHPNRNDGPTIVIPPAPDFWDMLIGNALRGSLSGLDGRLFTCMQWEREAEFSPHITHRFAFLWVALESMLPDGECSEAEVVRRFSLVAFSPAGAARNAVPDVLKDSRNRQSR
jgi:hypothetical protein